MPTTFGSTVAKIASVLPPTNPSLSSIIIVGGTPANSVGSPIGAVVGGVTAVPPPNFGAVVNGIGKALGPPGPPNFGVVVSGIGKAIESTPPPPDIPDVNWPDLSGLGRLLGQLGFGSHPPPTIPTGVSDTFDPSNVVLIRPANPNTPVPPAGDPPVVPPPVVPDPVVPPVVVPPVVVNPLDPANPVAPVPPVPPVLPQPVLVMPYNGQTPIAIQQIVDHVQSEQPVVASQHAVEAGPAVVGLPNGQPLPNNFQVLDETSGMTFLTPGATYPGPVAGITSEFIDLTPANLQITALTAGVFMHSGAGDDTLTALAGSNLLNAGGGSNTMVGGLGADTFIVAMDATKSAADLIQNFHAGDDLVVAGLTPQDFTYGIGDVDGSLVIMASSNSNPDIINSIALPGHSTAELDGGKLQWAFSSDGSGTSFMSIHAA